MRFGEEFGVDAGDDRLVGSGAKCSRKLGTRPVAAELRRQTHYWRRKPWPVPQPIRIINASQAKTFREPRFMGQVEEYRWDWSPYYRQGVRSRGLCRHELWRICWVRPQPLSHSLGRSNIWYVAWWFPNRYHRPTVEGCAWVQWWLVAGSRLGNAHPPVLRDTHVLGVARWP